MAISKEKVAELIGRRIRELRQKKGMTMEALSVYSDMEYIQLSRIERGKINTTIFQVYKISKALSEPMPKLFEPFTKDIMETRDHSNGASSEKPNE
jgi:transcriptional regulator with XRE-family HTH domain